MQSNIIKYDIIDQVFGAGGIMAQRFEGYEPRPGQVAMAYAVEHAIGNGDHLVCEAMTGVGKSRAALVPAIDHALRTGQRVLIATANIALQEQYCKKDLPALQRELPKPFTFALVKGRSNFACLDRFEREDRRELEVIAAAEHFDLAALYDWVGSTATGDVSEGGNIPGRLWARLSVGSDRCKGKGCRHSAACFADRSRNAAAGANVIVANYHLLFADMVVRGASESSTGVLPPVQIVIADEAHKIPDTARGFLAADVSDAALRRLVTDAMRTAGEAGVQFESLDPLHHLEDASAELFGDLLALKQSTAYHVRLRAPDMFDPRGAVAALKECASLFGGMSSDVRVDVGQRHQFRKLRERANTHGANLLSAAQLTDSNCVYFIEERPSGRGTRAVLRSLPVDVSSALRVGLFAEHTVVCMSATIAVNKSFEHFRAQVGCDDGTDLIVDSPFDMRAQALLVVPAGLPDPRESAYRQAVPEFVSKAIAGAGGRTLALFTTWKNLQSTAAHLRADGTAAKYRLLVQGEGPRTDLINEFRADPSSVLLGTASFWEGVDVVGEALSCVVIDRLPFATPDDPVLDVITSRDPRGWFSKWSVPHAIIAFRQGFGRLIRSKRDRGVVVCLDRRLVDKSYGKMFMRALGGVRISRDIADVGKFLKVLQGQLDAL